MHSDCLQEDACGHTPQENVALARRCCISPDARLERVGITSQGELGTGPLLGYTIFM